MNIRVNGRETEFDGGTVSELIETLAFSHLRLVVEKNGLIVQRDRYNEEAVSDGDVFEIVRFVGGG